MKLFKFCTGFLMTAILLLTACQIENELPLDIIRQVPKISVNEASVFEADENSVLEFEVELSWDYTEEIRVDYQTNSFSEGAEENIDYIPTNGTIIFPAGEVSQKVNIPIIGDNRFEIDDTLQLKLSNPINARILAGGAFGIIKNDDNINDLAIPTSGYITPESYEGMELVWADEFNGTSLNTDDWGYDIGTGSNGWGNNELQYYTEENASVKEGNLVIEATKESFGGREYTSSRIKTQGKKSFRFGRIDIRAVMPEGKGIWPATWMLGTKFNAVGWPACGEIDIMEYLGDDPNRVLGTCHYGTNFANHNFTGRNFRLSDSRRFTDEYHVFSFIWEKDKMEWYVDDELFFEFDKSGVGNQPYPFNDNFFFIFNVAVGGNLPGSPDGTTNFPQRMIVDYVRVFK